MNFSKVKSLILIIPLTLVAGIVLWSFAVKKEPARVLVFSKTVGYRHESIPAGIEAIKKLGTQHNFIVDTTENASRFNEEHLKKYSAVIFLNTTMDVLESQQQADFERYIQAGGGFVGVHSATDTEYSWPWYGKLVGAYFKSHPATQKATFYIVDKNHPSTDSLPERIERTDELYNYKNINPDLKVLMKLDEKSYKGGENGDNHPIAWYHEYDGGRAFYTGLGHTKESYQEPFFLKHLWGGIKYAIGGNKPLNYQLAKSKRTPEENRFTKVILAEKLDEPMEMAVLPDNRVIVVERKGNVKIWNPVAKTFNIIAKIPVSTKYTSGKEAEDGLLGVQADPNYAKNNWIYLYYSPAGADPKNILTRYELRGDKLIEESKKVLLEVKTQRDECCHTGGSIDFDAKGNLFLSTGDNTNPHASGGYSPSDERPGRLPWDAQKGSANTNDLRGKIIRIHPEADGTYTIPDGNLFPKGTAKTRPEIYTMGHRNPFRIAVDKKTGYVYWGEVGPDANKDSLTRGPRGYDEVNQAKKPGNFGWPHFIADNLAYTRYDFEAGKSLEKFDVNKPINTSPNNTGLNELPPTQPAMIYYPYAASTKFPLVGSGGRTAMAGPVYYSSDFKNAKRAWPDYYDGKLLIYEWMRGWIMAVTFDEDGNYLSMEKVMPSQKFSNPMDMAFGPDGDLYVLEYGTSWFQGNDDARLVRIEYNGGNRKPIAKVDASKKKGAVPLTVKFSGSETVDYDKDNLKYEWKIQSKGTTVKTFTEANPSYTFTKPGIYNAVLTVTDAKGEKSVATLEVQAGNEPPVVSFDIKKGNKTFFFPGQSFEYNVSVTDKEDGSLAKKSIAPASVPVTVDYLKEGFDKIEIAQGHRSADDFATTVKGQKLVEGSDCRACHNIDKKSIGPAYRLVSEKYMDKPEELERLAKKVINGGSGVWGEVAMSAHPSIKMEDATEMVKYILSIAKEKKVETLPPSGTFTTTLPEGDRGVGIYILRAAYTDKGANGMPSITTEQVVTLKGPNLLASTADDFVSIRKFKLNNPPLDLVIPEKSGAYIGYDDIDLTDIKQLVFTVNASKERNNPGGIIEVRIDAPNGQKIGESEQIIAAEGTQNSQLPQQVVAKLTPANGIHKLYFVFKNEAVKEDQQLFVLLSTQFKSDELKQ